ncbi:MAG: hypothetical protein H8E44_02585 [Planctomycetes bacterium]|nr:hypothetical protein [Planctomycetota bacterium]
MKYPFGCVSTFSGTVPGRLLIVWWPMTTLPSAEVKTGSRVIALQTPPTSSNGSQMLYDAPNSLGLKYCVNCSGVKTNLRSGALAGEPLSESS